MAAGGQEPESAYPYQGEDGKCSFNKGKAVAHISNWTYATDNYDEEQMRQVLYQRGPLSVCVNAIP
jgi:hypothetical protein